MVAIDDRVEIGGSVEIPWRDGWQRRATGLLKSTSD